MIIMKATQNSYFTACNAYHKTPYSLNKLIHLVLNFEFLNFFSFSIAFLPIHRTLIWYVVVVICLPLELRSLLSDFCLSLSTTNTIVKCFHYFINGSKNEQFW